MTTQKNQHPEQASVKPVDSVTYFNTGILDTGWHQHAEHQLIYAEGGVLYVHTQTSHFLLPAYHGAWIPAHCAHNLVSHSDKTKLWLLYFQPAEKEVEVLQSVRIFALSLMAREMLRYTERWSRDENVTEETTPLAKSFYDSIRLFAEEWCAEPISLFLPHPADDLLAKVTQHILENMGESLRVKDVAQIYGVSGRTLMRLFRSQLGTTFGAYLRTARIVKAVELLTSPSASVLEVAYDVGYKSPSSFSQAFRRLTGMSPQEYALRQ